MLVLVPVFALLHAVVAVPRISEWGTTGAERRAGWPGDGLTDARYTWTNAITIDAPADRVWPWVTQLGQGRAGLYSYDWVENAMFAGIRSKDRILAEHQRPLAVGDKVVRMTRYSPYNPVALYVPGRALVLGAVGDNVDELRAGHASSTWAFIVEPVGSDTSRLIVRSRSSGLATRLQAPAQFVMQRRLMEGVKARAEGTWTPSPGDVIEPLTWLVVAGTTTVAAWFATRRRRDWWQPLAVAVLGGCVLGYLLFWQPPLPVAITLALLMAFAGAADQYNVRTRIRSESTSARRPRLKHA